ncbi:hypothetical protein HELRODRAFT_63394, partial [Helobdella robusta]|uniref:39S ribosomal protein L55, mitochondrial n=1 Tax=Helobdella robusta TaxID=6412 RepID=T1FXF3_HELRO
NSHKAAVSRLNRKVYVEVYPTLLIYPNGSMVTLRYKEPRRIIQLPLDLSTLSEKEKLARQSKRKPKLTVMSENEILDSFDVNKYSYLWKK